MKAIATNNLSEFTMLM